MTGSRFVRADLHVHTHNDSDRAPAPDFDRYIQTAIDQSIDVLAITDHNRVDFVRPALAAATGKPIFVLPGIEISTHDGHLLALFAPEKLEALDALAAPGNLKLTAISETERRSTRSMLDLVQEIAIAGGLAIPAHVDAATGAGSRLSGAQWEELLTSPALAGLEFATKDALTTWFSDSDADDGRRAAWKARQKKTDLNERGLARLMSSDAHSSDQVGRDRASRTLTRLRLDDANFTAVRNAIALNPKARCKAEVVLPATYPRIERVEFEGGFLDGVALDFTANLNCLIGGRGSGKSTALLSTRAALGARLGPDEDPDDADRMPTKTTVTFVDATGSRRIAIRERGQTPVDPAGAPIRLRLADLGQEETGRLAQNYNDDPEPLLEFLDGFIVRHKYDEREAELIGLLEENASEVLRTSGIAAQSKKQEEEELRLSASLKAATEGRVEEIAQWATILASQGPMLDELESRLSAASEVPKSEASLSLNELAQEFGVDLTAGAAAPYVEGDTGLRQELATFASRRSEIVAKANTELASTATPVKVALARWRVEHANLEKRLKKRQAELEGQGLKVQAGAVRDIATRLNEVKTTLTGLRKRQSEHDEARKTRKQLIDDLHHNRETLFLERDVILKHIAQEANAYADDLTIRVWFDLAGTQGAWIAWLTENLGFRKPRVLRLAKTLSPLEFARQVTHASGRAKLLALKDSDNTAFFTRDQIERSWKWPQIFELETLLLPDRPRIEVQRRGTTEPQAFDHLSTGQQRSVLLGLLLCAERNEPLVLDQPEDHLDGQYIASSVVRHLEAAKEKRQILIATHSANLTVLGDAELVIPMIVKDGKGWTKETGAVDRPETRDHVCALLEGGVEAYKKRGRRYGLQFAGESS